MCPSCYGGEQGNEGEEDLLMVLRSLYCWGTKLIPLPLGRAVFLGGGTRAASPWRCGTAAGTWQEWSNTCLLQGSGQGGFQKLGTVVWDGTGSGCASLAARGISHGQSLWPAPGVPSVGCRDTTGHSVPWLREGGIRVFLMCL